MSDLKNNTPTPCPTKNYDLNAILKELSCWCTNWKGNINAVYGNELSLVEKVEHLFSVIKTTVESQENITECFTSLYNFVNDYFTNLNLQNEVNTSLKEMAKNGELQTILENTLLNNIKNNYMLIDVQPTKILCCGDSLTWGYMPNSGTQVANPYPLILQNLLPNTTVVNKGVNGALSAYSLTHFDEYLTEKPDIIIWGYGTNDVNQNIPVNSTLSNLQTFNNKCIENNVALIVLGIPPLIGVNMDRIKKQEYLSKSIEDCCLKNGIPNAKLFDNLTTLYQTLTLKRVALQPDGTHFTDYSYFAYICMKTCFSYLIEVFSAYSSEYCVAWRNKAIQTTATFTSRSDISATLERWLVLKNSDNLKYTFYTNSYSKLSAIILSSINTGILTLKIDGQNVSYETYTTDNPPKEYKIPLLSFLPSGFHTIELVSVKKGATAYEDPSVYLEGFCIDSLNAPAFPFQIG